MVNKEKLYEAFGELLYAVAISDGVVQQEEKAKLEEKLAQYSWGEQVLWSFNYEAANHHNLKGAYDRAFSVMNEYGPFREFYEFMQLLEEVAASSQGIDSDERQLIDRFHKEIKDAFMNNPNIR